MGEVVFLFLKKVVCFLLLPIFMSATTLAFSGEVRLSEEKLLQRCYAHMTGERLPANSVLWSQLQQQRAQNICTNLLNSVFLGGNGYLVQKDNIVHRKILRQFYDLHRSWFGLQWSLDANTPEGGWGTVDVFDPTEPSLHITQALFAQTPVHYQEVLRGNSHLRALRETTASFPFHVYANDLPRVSRLYHNAAPLVSVPQVFMTYDNFGQNASGVDFDLLALGDLVGIGNEKSVLISNLWINPRTSTVELNEPHLKRPALLRNNFGGGAIGSSSHFLLYLGHPFDYRADGSKKLPRRWVESFMKQFLCREGPYVRDEDALAFLVKDVNAAPFRQSLSCLRCHTTLDQSAMVARNIRLASTFNGSPLDPIRRYSALVAQYNSSAGPYTSWSAYSVDNFHLTQPSGRLYFRDYKGKLVDRTVNSINDLGIALSNTPDYYACAAQKYFSYLTGIDVNVAYLSAPENASFLTRTDIEYRDYVISLGDELQKTGSLRKLIETIMLSGYYQHEQRER